MIKVVGLKKTYRTGMTTVEALQGVSFEVKEREFFVLLGPSGCGKTTLLRSVAGLEKPDGGQVYLRGQLMSDAATGTFIPPERRGLGMVFQSYAVWPHLSVFDNVAMFLLHGRRKIPRDEATEKVRQALHLVKLDGMERRPAPLLSGGQQQRVALARALVTEPQVLLMDEPLSNLDARLREGMRDEMKDLVKRLGVTVLYVTHDQTEAMGVADRIAVIHAGRLVQEGGAEDIYQFPRTQLVAEFFGQVNLLIGVIGDGKLSTSVGDLACPLPQGCQRGERVTVVVRPEEIGLFREKPLDGNVLEGRVLSRSFLGAYAEYCVEAKALNFVVTATPRPGYEVGENLFLQLPMKHLRILPPE